MLCTPPGWSISFISPLSVFINYLGGVLPTPRPLLSFVDDESFTFPIAFAEIALSMDTLSHILNHYVFAAPDAWSRSGAQAPPGYTRSLK